MQSKYSKHATEQCIYFKINHLFNGGQWRSNTQVRLIHLPITHVVPLCKKKRIQHTVNKVVNMLRSIHKPIYQPSPHKHIQANLSCTHPTPSLATPHTQTIRTTPSRPDNPFTPRQPLHAQTTPSRPDNPFTPRQPLHAQTTPSRPDNPFTPRQPLYAKTTPSRQDNPFAPRQPLHAKTTPSRQDNPLAHTQTTVCTIRK